MGDAGYDRRRKDRQWRRGATWVGAIVVSTALHVVAIREMPAITWLGLLETLDVRRYLPFQLGEVKTYEPEKEKDRAERRLRAQDPTRMVAQAMAAQLPSTPLAEIIPQPEAIRSPRVAPAAANRPLAGPEPSAAPEPWDVRQDILKINQQVEAQDAFVKPRRIIPDTKRKSRAPDVTWPSPEVGASAAMPGMLAVGESAGTSLSIPRFLPEGQELRPGWSEGGGGGDSLPLAPMIQRPDVAEENPKDVAVAEATEQFLNLETLRYEPADEPGITYFELRISRKNESGLPVIPKDMLIMQDCSGSITPWKLAECKEGMRRCLALLQPGDRVDLIRFSEKFEKCFDAYVELTPENKRKALKFIDDMTAEGDTDVYASLEAALRTHRTEGRPLLVMLNTDGRPTVGTTDSSDIIDKFTRKNGGNISVFTFGAGRKVNRFLLELLSYRNRADSRVEDEADRIPDTMEAWYGSVKRPVLTDLDYHFAGLSEAGIYPSTLTHLYLDRPLVIYGRLDRGVPEEAAFQVVGRSGSTARDLVFSLDLKKAATGSEETRQRWSWHRIYSLYARYVQTRDTELLTQIAILAEQSGIPQAHRMDLPLP